MLRAGASGCQIFLAALKSRDPPDLRTARNYLASFGQVHRAGARKNKPRLFKVLITGKIWTQIIMLLMVKDEWLIGEINHRGEAERLMLDNPDAEGREINARDYRLIREYLLYNLENVFEINRQRTCVTKRFLCNARAHAA